jgi:type III restriction enzyme
VKYTLKDYQRDAAELSVENLIAARARFRSSEQPQHSAFSLTATTGAGKTVIATAVVEALFYGNPDRGVKSVAGAVVLWLSDDPSLNEQTRNKFMEASERFHPTNAVMIEPPFSLPKLEAGKVYFINTQKLSARSLLVRGAQQVSESLPTLAPPDAQAHTFWETIANTIADPNLTLFFIQDEAHRGFNSNQTPQQQTIVQRLVGGDGPRGPLPIVWGISATAGRFDAAMAQAGGEGKRHLLPNVLVPPERVQASGIIKDVIAIQFPTESGNFDTALVRVAARRLSAADSLWLAYSVQQAGGDAELAAIERVIPLLVLQCPDTPDKDLIGRALDAIKDVIPEIGSPNVRHVFGEHTTQKFGAWDVDYIAPDQVQGASALLNPVRVLVAKTAISTGWDCPRAEVLISFRPAKDHTYVTQLLGRMVRNPLARRIEGDERYNTVECIVPYFDRATALAVVESLSGGSSPDVVPGAKKKVVLDPKTLSWNTEVPIEIKAAFQSLPSETVPRGSGAPTSRLTRLARHLSSDGVDSSIYRSSVQELVDILEKQRALFRVQVEERSGQIAVVEIKRIVLDGVTKLKREYTTTEVADEMTIRHEFAAAGDSLGHDVAKALLDRVVPEDSDDAALIAGMLDIAALGQISEVRDLLDRAALARSNALFVLHQDAIANLRDERKAEYEEVRAQVTEPVLRPLVVPRHRVEGFGVHVPPTTEDSNPLPLVVSAETVERHLLAFDAKYPLTDLNEWEKVVVKSELKNPAMIGWYRNPSHPVADALTVAYRDVATGNWRSMQPDFIFFHQLNGKIRASIVDPHGHHLDDAMAKLKALAGYAGRYGDKFYRIESVGSDGPSAGAALKRLDLKSEPVRKAVSAWAGTALELYQSAHATQYP